MPDHVTTMRASKVRPVNINANSTNDELEGSTWCGAVWNRVARWRSSSEGTKISGCGDAGNGLAGS